MKYKTTVYNTLYRIWLNLMLLTATIVSSTAALAGQGPIEVLQGMSDHVLEIIKKDPTVLDDKARLRSIANEVVVPNVDFQALSQSVLGINWRKATSQQREIFEREFRELLINTYLSSISRADYNGQSIRYLPMRYPPNGDRAEVEAEIQQPNGPLIHAQFRMNRRGEDWKVYDVIAEGVSLVITQRSSFSTIIRDKGLDGLIAMLEDRNNKRNEQAEFKQQPATKQ